MRILKIFILIFTTISPVVLQAQSEDSLLFTLEIIVNGINIEKPLENANVKIIGTDGSSRSFSTDEYGRVSPINLDSNTSYSIIIEKSKYAILKGKETTVGELISKSYIHEYIMQPMIICKVFLYNQYYKKDSLSPFLAGTKWDSECEVIPVNYYFDLMKENPTLVMQVIGYCSSIETKTTSKKRAEIYVEELINMGINKNRLLSVDGGVRSYKKVHYRKNRPKEDLSQENRVIMFRIIRDDFPIKN